MRAKLLTPVAVSDSWEAPAREAAPSAPLLLTLGAMACCLAPFVTRLPWWASVVTAVLLLYRVGVAQGRVAALSARVQTLLLGLVALACAWGLYQQFGTLLGRDGGGAALVVLLGLKGVESRTSRDLHLVVLLGFFVTVTHFFYVQGALTLLHALLSMSLLCAAVALGERPALLGTWTGVRPLLGRLWAPAALTLLQAAPLAAALFVLFPRPDSPLWQMPVSTQQASSGLSDSVNPGAISSLALSDEVAFRAQFDAAAPPPRELYWRGPVMEFFDGAAWRIQRFARGEPTQLMTQAQSAYTYTLTLEPSNRAWVLALDAPTTVPSGTLMTTNLQVIKPSLLGARTRLRLSAATHYQYGLNASAAWLQRNLQLPGGNPRTRQLAQSWLNLPPERRVQAGLNLFRQGGFAYTLSPPTLSAVNGVDDFIFKTHRGFCEHYASAFAFMMRAAGVPARVITGYQGAEPNGPYFIVRQANAHAWTEVWLASRGWVRVDPTAVVSPQRIERGLSALPGAPALATGNGGVLGALRLRLDGLQNLWNTWVIGYDGLQQRQLFQQLGLGELGGWKLTLVGTLVLLAAALPLLLRRPARQEPLSAAYALLTRRLKLHRYPSEAASAYGLRAAERYPAQAAEIWALLEQYQRLRYAPAPNEAALGEFVRGVRRFKPKF